MDAVFFKRVEFSLGILFLITGLVFFGLSDNSITGAVTGSFGAVSESTVLGLIFILASFALFTAGNSRKKTTLDDFVKKRENNPSSTQLSDSTSSPTAIILDTGFLFNYRTPQEMEKFFKDKKYTNTAFYVPEEMVESLNISAEKVVAKYCKLISKDALNHYNDEANKYLQETEKARLADYLIPFIKGEKIPSSNRERAELAVHMRNINKYMQEHGWNPDLARKKPDDFKKQVLDYLEHFKVGKGDLDVISGTLALAKRGSCVEVFSNDSHIRDALKSIKDKEYDVHYVPLQSNS